MNADLIAAACLFGPGILAAPALAVGYVRGRREIAAVDLVLGETRSETPEPPPDAREPLPVSVPEPVAGLATVLTFPAHRAA
ncbi:hypothetical protein G3I60_36435 [Streptomyces sp. SID13666]|uniref:hypothetical protein n=1 Tax=Streptomyces sp. SID13666 TaxID=2706054 RepID=UPI0013C28D00|nr:hypothetical protein [Streptomyces sp. SID13666]NEA59506.1 hypothetical protein [Streptomyces sp. SID13666]